MYVDCSPGVVFNYLHTCIYSASIFHTPSGVVIKLQLVIYLGTVMYRAGSCRYEAVCFSKPCTCIHTLSHADDLGVMGYEITGRCCGCGGVWSHMTVALQNHSNRTIPGKLTQADRFPAPLTDAPRRKIGSALITLHFRLLKICPALILHIAYV